jgi:hypothetical protein
MNVVRDLLADLAASGATAEPGPLIRRALLDIRAVKSSILERNVLRIGDVFALWYPMTKSMVSASPSSGRLTTDHGNRFFA